MTVTNIAKLERFFRLAAQPDIDKEDLGHDGDFVHRKTYDLLLRTASTSHGVRWARSPRRSCAVRD